MVAMVLVATDGAIQVINLDMEGIILLIIRTHPVVTVPSASPVYIQQGTEPQSVTELPDNYCHYCQKPEGYYPYVKK